MRPGQEVQRDHYLCGQDVLLAASTVSVEAHTAALRGDFLKESSDDGCVGHNVISHRCFSTHAPAHEVGQRLPGWPLLPWQRGRPKWSGGHEPGRDLTSARDTNCLGHRVVSPALRAGPQLLSGLPIHADEPTGTPDGKATKPRTRRAAFNVPRQGP